MRREWLEFGAFAVFPVLSAVSQSFVSASTQLASGTVLVFQITTSEFVIAADSRECYACKGMYAESFASCEKVATLFRDNPHSRALRSLILAMTGKTEETKAILTELNDQPKLDPIALIRSAESWSVLGEKEKAFQFLEAAYQDRVSILIYLGVRPTFSNIRPDPRFADLLRRMGLPHVPLPHAG